MKGGTVAVWPTGDGAGAERKPDGEILRRWNGQVLVLVGLWIEGEG